MATRTIKVVLPSLLLVAYAAIASGEARAADDTTQQRVVASDAPVSYGPARELTLSEWRSHLQQPPAPAGEVINTTAAGGDQQTDSTRACRGVRRQSGIVDRSPAPTMQQIQPYVRVALKRIVPPTYQIEGDVPPALEVAWTSGKPWVNAVDEVSRAARFCVDINHDARTVTVIYQPYRWAREARR